MTRRKSRRMRVLEGNPGNRDLPASLMLPPGAPPEPHWPRLLPGKACAELRRDARSIWRRIVPPLDRGGALSVVDTSVLTDFCVCWARLLDCERVIAREGMTVQGERGTTKHPAITAANQYRAQIRFYVGQLGLGPLSRTSLDLPPTDEQTDAERRVFGD